MNDLLYQLKNILKELLIVFFFLAILVSFIAPVSTLWGGPFYYSVKLGEDAVNTKTTRTYIQMQAQGSFDWDEEDEVKSNGY